MSRLHRRDVDLSSLVGRFGVSQLSVCALEQTFEDAFDTATGNDDLACHADRHPLVNGGAADHAWSGLRVVHDPVGNVFAVVHDRSPCRIDTSALVKSGRCQVAVTMSGAFGRRLAGGSEDNEFLAAPSNHNVRTTQPSLENVGEPDEYVIARRVSVLFVHATAVVEIEHEHGDGPVKGHAADAAQSFRDHLSPRLSSQEACERTVNLPSVLLHEQGAAGCTPDERFDDVPVAGCGEDSGLVFQSARVPQNEFSFRCVPDGNPIAVLTSHVLPHDLY